MIVFNTFKRQRVNQYPKYKNKKKFLQSTGKGRINKATAKWGKVLIDTWQKGNINNQ